MCLEQVSIFLRVALLRFVASPLAPATITCQDCGLTRKPQTQECMIEMHSNERLVGGYPYLDVRKRSVNLPLPKRPLAFLGFMQQPQVGGMRRVQVLPPC